MYIYTIKQKQKIMKTFKVTFKIDYPNSPEVRTSFVVAENIEAALDELCLHEDDVVKIEIRNEDLSEYLKDIDNKFKGSKENNAVSFDDIDQEVLIDEEIDELEGNDPMYSLRKNK